MVIEEINYSYTVFKTDDIDIKYYIMDLLSVFIPGYKFMPKVKAGLSDGKRKFYKITTNGNLLVPSGLVSMLIAKLDKRQYEYQYNPLPKKFSTEISYEKAKEYISNLNLPFEPHDYQLEAFVNSLKYQKLVSVMATGSGKSLTIALLLEYFRQLDIKTVLVVPNINLLEQFKSDIEDYNLVHLDNEVHLIGGDYKIKHFDNKITICTWQSLANSMNVYEDVDALIIDECHSVKGDVLNEIIKNSSETSIKLGFSGTLPEFMVDKMTLLGTIGRHKEFITAKELINRGLGTPIVVNAVFLNYNNEDIKKEVKKMKYSQEIKYLEELEVRNKFIVKTTKKVSKKYGNTLLLFSHTKHGETLWEMITGTKITRKLKNDYKAQSKLGVFFINGEVKGKTREEIRNLLEKPVLNIKFDDENIRLYEDERVFDTDILAKELKIGDVINNKKVTEISRVNQIICANYQVLGTGVNIKNLHCMVMASTSKSEIRVRQTLGRGIRTHENKEIFRVFDIVDDLTYYTRNGNPYPNYMLKHWESRLDIYQKQYFEVKEIEYNLI